MEQIYWVRYGLMRRLGRFRADSDTYRRGDTVVIQSHRGTELGEVLIAETTPAPSAPAPARLLRLAEPEDLDRARRAELDRPRRLAVCEQVFQSGVWPLELIDVEPLLDDRRTVLHYLGPHHLDNASLLAALSAACDLDILLEPAGLDEPEEHGCGSCGPSDRSCASGSGCGSHQGGCSGCAVQELLSRRRSAAVH